MTASIANAWGDRSVGIATEAQRHGFRVPTPTKKAERKGLCLLFRLRGSRGRRIPRAFWLSSLAKSASYRLSERPLPTLKRNRKAIEEDTQHHPLTLTFKPIYTHTHTHTCMTAHRHVHIYTYEHTSTHIHKVLLKIHWRFREIQWCLPWCSEAIFLSEHLN